MTKSRIKYFSKKFLYTYIECLGFIIFFYHRKRDNSRIFSRANFRREEKKCNILGSVRFMSTCCNTRVHVFTVVLGWIAMPALFKKRKWRYEASSRDVKRKRQLAHAARLSVGAINLPERLWELLYAWLCNKRTSKISGPAALLKT